MEFPAVAQWWGGAGGGGGSSGASGTITAGSNPALAMYQGTSTTTVSPVTVGGDATIASSGTLTVTKSGGTVFGTAAFQSTGTSGPTLPFANGNNTFAGTNTFSGTDNFSGTFQIGGFSLGLGVNTTLPAAPASTQCLHMSNAGAITAFGSDCAAGTPVVFVGPTAGAANTYTIASPTPSGFALAGSNQFIVQTTISNTNTGASTLNVNGTGALPIVSNVATGLVALVSGELISGGLEYTLVPSNSTAAACGGAGGVTAATCYVNLTSPGTAVSAGTSQTVTASQWATFTVFTVTSSAQTITLPASSGLPQNGGIIIITATQPVTLAPNAADQINNGVAGQSTTISPGLTALVVKSSAGNIAVTETGAIQAAAYNTVASATSLTLTAAQVTGGTSSVDLSITGTTAITTFNTPTATAIIAAMHSPAVGASYKLKIINAATGATTSALTAGAGVTMAAFQSGVQTIANASWREWVVTVTNVATPAVTFQSVATGTWS